MRLPCYMRELRGDRTLTEVEDDTGINRGTLSQIERGILLPLDRHLPELERVYGPRAGWYPPEVLVELQRGDGEPPC